MNLSDFPEEPLEAQPPPGVRLDDVYVYQGARTSSLDVKDSVKITYIDDVEDDGDWAEVGPEPVPVIVE